MNKFMRSFLDWFRVSKDKEELIDIPLPVPQQANPFKDLANIVCEPPSNRIHDLELSLACLDKQLQVQRSLLFKALCILYSSKNYNSVDIPKLTNKVHNEYSLLTLDENVLTSIAKEVEYNTSWIKVP